MGHGSLDLVIPHPSGLCHATTCLMPVAPFLSPPIPKACYAIGFAREVLLSVRLATSFPAGKKLSQSLQNFPAVTPENLGGTEMEVWLPLFDIFMNSPSPEFEASLWLQQSFNALSTPIITTGSFLSLLTKPCDTVIVDSSSSCTKRQTNALYLFICRNLFEQNG